MRKLAAIDGLTGALTPRAFAFEAKRETARVRRNGRSLGCILFDLDHFKDINDTLGHAAGDLVLRSIAGICESELRAVDVLGRIGGEEFAVMLPETPINGALETAERLRHKISEAPISYGGKAILVTASFGVAVYEESDWEFTKTLQRADRAMYLAKTTGRNRVILAEGKQKHQGAAA